MEHSGQRLYPHQANMIAERSFNLRGILGSCEAEMIIGLMVYIVPGLVVGTLPRKT